MLGIAPEGTIQSVLRGGGRDPYWLSVIFMWECEGPPGSSALTPPSFSENSSYHRVFSIPAGTAKFDNAHVLVGNTSYFPGTSEATVPASSDFQLAPTASSPFTLELSIFNGTGSIGDQWDIIDVWLTAPTQRSWLLRRISGTGELTFFYSLDGSASIGITTAGAGCAALNTWLNICVENSATKLRIYVNGIMKGSGVLSGGMFNGNQVMAMETPIDNTTSWLDHIRITKGVARYNSDSGYTVPITAFPRA